LRSEAIQNRHFRELTAIMVSRHTELLFHSRGKTEAGTDMRTFSPSFEAVQRLDELPVPLFERLLASHALVLKGANIDPAALKDARSVWEHQDKLPLDFVDALHRAHDMGDDVGHDDLLAVQGGPLFVADSASMSAFTLAVRTLLDKPESFNRAHSRRCVESLRRFREFPGRMVAPVTVSAVAMAAAQSRFSASFARRDRTDFCRIRPWCETNARHFMISHGRCFRTDPAVMTTAHGTEETFVPWRPQQHDLVILDERTGRLRVSATDVHTLGDYLAGFGEALFGDPSWFREGEVVSLDPLLLAGSAALRPTPGLLAVNLVELRIATRTGVSAFAVYGDDVFATLRDMAVDPGAHGALLTAKFRVQFKSDRQRRTVTIGVPDRVGGDWRRDNAAVRGFLETRGFLAGPVQEATCQVA
jgi:hypothetical protein